MKNFTKYIVATLSTIAFSGAVQADQITFDKNQIQNEIAVSINTAVADINKPVITTVAKVELDRMTFMQNVEQFLVLVQNNEELTSAKVEVIAE